MGHGFGGLYYIRGIIQYRLSSHEQRAFAGYVSHAIPNTIRRLKDSFLYVVPPLGLGYLVYDQVEKSHQQLMRKDPKEFENDK